MFKKIINFIKYSNVFTIAAIVVFVVIATAMASNDDIKNRVLGEKIVTESGIDNSVILAADLENFDLEMKIIDIREDEDNYYLAYQFQTLGIRENIWQTILRQKELKISKKALAGQDLGLYAAEELGEVIDYELAYLKEVQENENKKGDDRIVQETKYEGLLGLIISTKTKELPPEYELVVKPPVVEETDNWSPDESQGDDGYPDDSSYYQKLKELCEANDLFWYDKDCHDEPEIAPVPSDQEDDDSEDVPVCDADNLSLCDSKDLCDEINLFWYGNVCNDEEEVVIPGPVCDSANLNLCDESDCETKGGGFWYGGICNVEEEVVAEPEPEIEPEPVPEKEEK